MKQRDYEGALVFFGSALEQLPEEGLYHAYYGWCLHLCHPDNEVIVQEAAEHIQEGIRLARDEETPYVFLGRLYKVMGKMSAAEKMFTRAVQLKADCVEALRELRLLNMRRDKKKGLIGRILKKP
jgi:tetratricopeptide (TPR) repeat protein